MKAKNVLNGLSVILILVFTSQLAAGQQHMDQNKKCNEQFKGCKDIPGLTEDQKSKIETLRNNHQKQMLNLKAQKQTLDAELYQLEIADSPDMNKINSKIDEISAVTNKMDKERSKHKQDVRSILTPEQRISFDNNSGGGAIHRKCMNDGYENHSCPNQQKHEQIQN